MDLAHAPRGPVGEEGLDRLLRAGVAEEQLALVEAPVGAQLSDREAERGRGVGAEKAVDGLAVDLHRAREEAVGRADHRLRPGRAVGGDAAARAARQDLDGDGEAEAIVEHGLVRGGLQEPGDDDGPMGTLLDGEPVRDGQEFGDVGAGAGVGQAGGVEHAEAAIGAAAEQVGAVGVVRGGHGAHATSEPGAGARGRAWSVVGPGESAHFSLRWACDAH